MKKSKVIVAIILSIIVFASGLASVLISLKEFYSTPFSESEGSTMLNITTYIDGDNQPTHPSVIDLKSKWNGYRYWMSYSPYPYSDGSEENPCIAVSNDMYHWMVPKGLNNPIAFNEETACDEYKDPHILYNNDTDSIEVWYLGRVDSTIKNGGKLMMFRKVSKDGINWSKYEIMREMTGYVSQSLTYEKKYKLWSISPSTNGKEGNLLYSESVDGKNWSEGKPCSFNGSQKLKIWHGAVSHDELYRFVYIDSSNNNSIMYAESSDGILWSKAEKIIEKENFWRSYYRPCIQYTDRVFYCIYGVITDENEWFLSMSTGKNINNLKGISVEDVGKSNMFEIIQERHSTKNLARDLYYEFKEYAINLSMVAICIIVFLFWTIIKKVSVLKTWTTSWILIILRQYGVLLYDSLQRSFMLIFTTGIVSLICILALSKLYETVLLIKSRK